MGDGVSKLLPTPQELCYAADGEYPANTADYEGYLLKNKLSSEANAQKIIWRGRGPDDKDYVLCFPKDFHINASSARALQHEFKVLQRIGPHQNIVEAVKLIPEWGGRTNMWCLVLELVEPLGYDMFEVFYQQATLQGERSVPENQIKYYVKQIASALEAIHARGVVHRDLKVDNVLIKGQHQVKIIDFGSATGPGISGSQIFNSKYTAPELARGMGDARADLFGIGIIIYSLCSGLMPESRQFEFHSRRGQLEGFLQKNNLTGDALEAALNLLHHDPAQRWNLVQVQDWAERTTLSRTRSGNESPFQRFSSHVGEIPHVFGLNLSDELEGKTIGDLGLFERTNMLVLLVIRNGISQRSPEDIISVPNPKTTLKKNDWLCFGLSSRAKKDVDQQKKLIEDILKIPRDGMPIDVLVDKCAKDQKFKWLYPFLPEFDLLTLPAYFTNAVLGPKFFAKPGQNALNLRAIFGINLAGIRHADGSLTWFPGPDADKGGLVRKGDCGLLIRVPPPGSGTRGTFMPSITKDQLETICDPRRFQHALGLSDTDWIVWMDNINKKPNDIPASYTTMQSMPASRKDLLGHSPGVQEALPQDAGAPPYPGPLRPRDRARSAPEHYVPDSEGLFNI